jgi:aldehyde:ferredoxin oxidoreductase
MMQAGERSFNLKRLINCRRGISDKDDILPERLLTHALADGGTKGYLPDQGKMLKEYYEKRGWDENGIPTPEKLRELSLTRNA